jgi:hypothetical protein
MCVCALKKHRQAVMVNCHPANLHGDEARMVAQYIFDAPLMTFVSGILKTR